jgi:hypothetical protein
MARVVTMHHETFNADFYVVAATIIPILYLALTLQGQTYERIIRRSVQEWVKSEQWSKLIPMEKAILGGGPITVTEESPSLTPGEFQKALDEFDRYLKEGRPHWWLFWTLNISGGLILAAGLVGEGLAIWALYAKPSSHVFLVIVLVLLFVLLVAVAAVPVLRVRTLYLALTEVTRTTGAASQTPSKDSEEPSE